MCVSAILGPIRSVTKWQVPDSAVQYSAESKVSLSDRQRSMAAASLPGDRYFTVVILDAGLGRSIRDSADVAGATSCTRSVRAPASVVATATTGFMVTTVSGPHTEHSGTATATGRTARILVTAAARLVPPLSLWPALP